MQEQRKLAFFEVDRGRLGVVIQEDFEKAQAIARERGVEVKIKVEMIVFPPDQKDPTYGSVSYNHQIIEPKHLSRRLEMCLNIDGIIVSDAAEPPEQLNLDLSLKTGPKALEFPKAAGAEGGTVE